MQIYKKGLKGNLKLNREDCFTILLVLVWTRTVLISYFFSLFKMLPIIGQASNAIKVLIYCIATAFALPFIFKRLKWKDVTFGIAVFFLYAVNIQLFPNTSDYLKDNWVYILLVNFMAYYIGLNLSEDKFLNTIYKCSRICILAIFLYFALFGFTAEEGRVTAENMGLAYRILPHFCVVCLFAFRNHKRLDIALSIISAMLVLACGVRGAVFSIVIFVFVYICFFYRIKHKPVFITVLTVLITIGYINFNSIANVLILFLSKFGFSTRVIEAVLDREAFVDAPRARIRSWMLEAISKHPFRGYGIAGDRNLIPSVVYAHSIWLEMLVSFGVIIGSLLILIILFIIVKAIIKASDLRKGLIIAMAFGGGLVKLFVSSSYLLEFEFFMLLGYCICELRVLKRKPKDTIPL